MRRSLAHLFSATTFFVVLISSNQSLRAECRSGASCTCDDEIQIENCYCQGRWFVSETENFRAFGDNSADVVDRLARHAERMRAELKSKWLPNTSSPDWKPKCEIVLHSTRQSYTAAVGRGSEKTVGSSA